eukprot:143181_1
MDNSSSKNIIDHDNDDTEKKTDSKYQNQYIRKCNTRSMIEIINNYALNTLYGYYSTKSSDYLSVINQSNTIIVTYFAINKIDGQMLYNMGKNQFAIGCINFIKQIQTNTIANMSNDHTYKLKQTLLKLYTIIINYEPYLENLSVIEHKQNTETKSRFINAINTVEKKPNINEYVNESWKCTQCDHINKDGCKCTICGKSTFMTRLEKIYDYNAKHDKI